MKTVKFMGLDLTLASTKSKIALEDKIGSPLQYLFGMMGGAIDDEDIDVTKMQIPPLKVMVLTIHASAQKLNANVPVEKVFDLVDAYLEKDENSVISLFTIFVELLQTGKYLPEDVKVEQVEEEVVEVKPAAKKPRAKKTVVEE